MEGRSEAVRIRDLTVDRGGRRVVSIDSLDLPAGRVTGLLGPSGCGKTTLMRCIVGTQRLRDEVTVLGLPGGSASLRRRVSYVIQTPSVYPDLTVSQNRLYFAAMLRAPRGMVHRVAEAVGR